MSAEELIAELGVDMSRFPSDTHLVSWAKFCPQTHQSPGKTTSKGRIKGNPWVGATLGNIAATSAAGPPSTPVTFTPTPPTVLQAPGQSDTEAVSR